MSTDYETGKSGRIAVFQVKEMTAEELRSLSPFLAASGTADQASFLWVRAHPRAGSSPHQMTPEGVVETDPWQSLVQDSKAVLEAPWVTNKDRRWKHTDSSGWRS